MKVNSVYHIKMSRLKRLDTTGQYKISNEFEVGNIYKPDILIKQSIINNSKNGNILNTNLKLKYLNYPTNKFTCCTESHAT